MASNLSKASGLRFLQKRAFAGHAAVAPKRAAGKEELKQTKLPNGLVVAALENYSPVSRVGVFVRAGPRYEGVGQLGVSHCIRNSAGLSTQSSTVFGITRNIEYNGGTLTATATREDLIYTLEGNRDSIGGNLKFLAETVTKPAFKPWEVQDTAYRMKIDLARAHENPQVVLLEALHKASFRGGLANSLLSPEFMVGHHTHDMLMSFVADNFLTNRMAVVGLGVEFDRLLDQVEKTFTMNTTGKPSKPVESKFVGGDVRVETGSPVTYAAIVAEGAGVKNNKEMLALTLFQHIIGTGCRVKDSAGANSRLGQAAAKATSEPFAVSGINISYSDLGLFGCTVAGSSNDIHKIVKAVVNRMRETAKSLKDADLKTAKQQLKSTVLMSLENQAQILEEAGTQALNLGQVLTGKELMSAIDAVSLQDVTSVVSRVMKGKGAIASVGQLNNMPYLEDLV